MKNTGMPKDGWRAKHVRYSMYGNFDISMYGNFDISIHGNSIFRYMKNFDTISNTHCKSNPFLWGFRGGKDKKRSTIDDDYVRHRPDEATRAGQGCWAAGFLGCVSEMYCWKERYMGHAPNR